MQWPAHLPGLLLLSPPTFPALPSLWLFSPLSSLRPLGLPICLCLCLGTLPPPLFNQSTGIHSAHLTSSSWVVGSEDNSSESKPKLYYFLSMWLLPPESQLPSCKTGMNTSPTSNRCCKGHVSLVHRELWRTALVSLQRPPFHITWHSCHYTFVWVLHCACPSTAMEAPWGRSSQGCSPQYRFRF